MRQGKPPFAPRGCVGLWLAFAVCRFVPPRRGSKRAWRKPSGPRRPARPCFGFRAGPLAFCGPVGGRSVVPSRGPTRRSRGRGVALWPVFSEFRPPAPLSAGVGRKRRKSESASGGRVRGARAVGWAELAKPINRVWVQTRPMRLVPRHILLFYWRIVAG